MHIEEILMKVFLEECKYFVKEKEVTRHIFEDLGKSDEE